MGLQDRLSQLRKGPGEQAAPAPKVKRERVGPLRYLREVRDELFKVSWPKRKQVVRGTVQVLVVTLIFTIILGGLDFAFQFGLKELLKKDLTNKANTTNQTQGATGAANAIPVSVPPAKTTK